MQRCINGSEAQLQTFLAFTVNMGKLNAMPHLLYPYR